MGLFDKMKEPVFLKETSDAQAQIEKLKALEPLLNSNGQNILRQDIKYLEYGIVGEKKIAFELKNSHMPMYVLHDIYLEDDDMNAQIDFLVITRKICFVVECKNLFGDIEINSAGDFIRTVEFYGRKRKEGVYSPITQNQRHMELLKKIRTEKNKSKISQFLGKKYFEAFNKSIVVLANSKTVLNAKYAKKDIKDKVIRADHLVRFIKDTYNQSQEPESSDNQLLDWAQSYLALHKQVEKDYTAKYQKYLVQPAAAESAPVQPVINNVKEEEKEKETEKAEVKVEIPSVSNIEDTEIFKELRAYRLNQSRKENIKPYYIYNDNQLKDLIAKMPRTLVELQGVSGFGEAKVKKYGEDILKIVVEGINGFK